MKKFLSVLLTLALLSMTVCAFADEPATSLVVATGSQFTTLDPDLNTETVNSDALTHLYANLFVKDENNIAQKQLCEDYTVSEDGLTYTFTIKQDAKWSDGVAVTANDFVYGILRTLSYGPDNAYAANDLLIYLAGAEEYNAAALEKGNDFDCTVEDYSMVGVKALDDYTLVLTLAKPCAFLTGMLCGGVFTPMREDVAPQHESSWAFEPGYPTTGAYTVAELNPTEKLVLAKNPNYISADEVVIDTLTFQVMTDSSAQELAFKTGEIDIATLVSADTAIAYQNTDNLYLLGEPVNYFLAINSGSTGPEYMKDVRVRKALNYAINKDVIVEVLGGTFLRQVINGYVPYGLAGKETDFRTEGDALGIPYTYDPEMAKSLLAEAGYDESNPLTITYKYSNNGIHGDVATMLQQMWQAVGINVELTAVEAGVFYDQIDNGDFEISRYGLSASNDPMNFFQIWMISSQIVPAIEDETFDQMLNDCAYITDADEYYDTLHEIENYFYGEMCYVIPLFTYGTTMLIPSGIQGLVNHGSYMFYGSVVLG